MSATALAPAPAEPYRGADEFRFVDRLIFHARTEETRVLLQKVTINRGVLLYGDSGAGKSSLVNAGLIPAALGHGLTIDRVLVQPVSGAEIVVDRLPIGEVGPPFLSSSLAGDSTAKRVPLSIGDFERTVRGNSQPRLLIFDQFEEIFTRFGGPGASLRDELVQMLLRLFYAAAVPLNLLLVFREEYLAKITDLLALAPDWISQSFWLRPPPKHMAKDIIRVPFDPEKLPTPYPQRFSEATIQNLAEQLAAEPKDSDRLSLTDLQIACLELWHADDADTLLKKVGATGLIERHLTGALSALQADVKDAAIALLSLMVTPDGFRNRISEDDAIGRVLDAKPAFSRKTLQDALGELVKTRLVRMEAQHSANYYDIVSEFLAPWIARVRRQRESELLTRRALKQTMIWVLGILLLVVATAAGFIWRYSALTVTAQRKEDAERKLKIQAFSERKKLQDQKAKLDAAKATLYDAGSLVADSVASVRSNPERSALLALQAIQMMFAVDGHTSQPANDALRLAAQSLQTDQLLIGHDRPVRTVTFGGDGRWVASAGDDSTIRLWDTFSGRQLGVLHGHHGTVRAIAFNLQASELASGDDDGTIKLWDVPALREFGTAMKSPDGVRALAFSPDGLQLASGGDKGLVRLWDASQRQVRRVLAGHHGAINSVAFSPTGRRLLSGSADGTAILWDLSQADVFTRIPYGEEKTAVSEVAISLDDRYIAIAGPAKVAKVFDAWQLNRPLLQIESTAPISGMCFGRDESLAISRSDGSIQIANRTFLVGHSGPVHAVDCAPDGERIATAGDDGSVRVLDLDQGPEYLRFRAHRTFPDALDVSRDGTRLLTVGAGTMRVWDAHTGRALFQVQSAAPKDAVFTKSGRHIAAAYDDRLELRSAINGAPAGGFRYPSGGTAPTFSLNGERLVAGSSVWDVESGRKVFQFDSPGGVAAFSTDGAVLAEIGNDRELRIWDLSAKTLRTKMAILDAVKGTQVHLAVSPDRERIVATAGSLARIWDLGTKRPVLDLVGHSEPIGNLVWLDKLVATSSDDGTVRIWDSESGKQLDVIPNHQGPVGNVLFSPDGSSIITSDQSGVVRVSPVDFHGLVALVLGRLVRTWTPDECNQMQGTQQCITFSEVFRAVVEGNRLARLGDLPGATQAYRRASQFLPPLGPSPEIQVKRLTAESEQRAENLRKAGLVAQAERFARAGNIESARAAINRAKELDITFEFNLDQLSSWAAEEDLLPKIQMIRTLTASNPEQALKMLAEITEAFPLSKIPASIFPSSSRFDLCWAATTNERAALARGLCEAVAEPFERFPSPILNFGRALNRALRGDRAGAIQDLQVYTARAYAGFVPRADAQRYMEALEKGQDPFTAEELKRLQDLYRLRDSPERLLQ